MGESPRLNLIEFRGSPDRVILSEADNDMYTNNSIVLKSEQTANTSKYPQGKFNDKPCKTCSETFSPVAPSEKYCTDECKYIGSVDRYLNRRYGITFADYNNMHKEQDGVCAICHEEGFLMAKHHKLKLVVDHCHVTGVVRGLLCHNCNRALGLLKDDTHRLDRAKDYLNVQRLSKPH